MLFTCPSIHSVTSQVGAFGSIFASDLKIFSWVVYHHLHRVVQKSVDYNKVFVSVAEPHHFYAAPALGETFVATPAPFLLYTKLKFLKGTKVTVT
jgi:hypothetical protein